MDHAGIRSWSHQQSKWGALQKRGIQKHQGIREI